MCKDVIRCTGLTLLLLWLSIVPGVEQAPAQLGGHAAVDGPCVLDDGESLDLLAEGTGRNWISDYAYPVGDVLALVSPAGLGLTLADGQTPNGLLKGEIAPNASYIQGGFGVPMPGVYGASSLDAPGDITGFSHFKFLVAVPSTTQGMLYSVMLETYPGPDYPKLVYRFSPTTGNTFQWITLDLRNPYRIENQGSYTIDDLLARTRYLSFYHYASGAGYADRLVIYYDDLTFVPAETGATATPTDAAIATPTPTDTFTFTPTPSPTPTTGACLFMLYGDVNADDAADNVDALIIQADFLELIDCMPADTDCDGYGPEGTGAGCPRLMYGDVNASSDVNNVDALMVHSYFLQLLDCLAVDTDCDGYGPEGVAGP